MVETLLDVKNLRVAFAPDNPVVDGIDFTIRRGETFALVGESGSGKSITALSVLRLLPVQARLAADAVLLGGENLLHYSEMAMCQVRGRRVAMIFQDPMSSLNPVMTIGAQIAEVLRLHALNGGMKTTHERVLQLLRQVELPDPLHMMKRYPHQLSGGQRQRVMIAMALAGEPDLLIADEPTTALDVTIQAQILHLLKTLQSQTGMALWLISHDLALVSNMAHRVAVMRRGKIVETGRGGAFFSHPQHAYTQQLLDALPSLQSCLQRPHTETPPLLQVVDFKVYFPVRKGIFKRVAGHVKAVDGVDFTLQQGKTLALVGESGCGKTTLGKGLLHLIAPTAGRVLLDGIELNRLRGDALRLKRAAMQIVFQDPFASMNPRMPVGDIVAEGLCALRPELDKTAREEIVTDLLQQVGLPDDAAQRYPHEFSGGQRQRICIARALAVEPKLIVCDEPTSALDVSVQAQIVQLLKKLQRDKGMSYLFISHDLAVVSEIADDVAVMYQGRIVEYGPVQQVLMQPQHAYTQKLLAALPVLQTATEKVRGVR
ncbi:MAG: ABC transporter ATP-binding protein [Gammaproteobacteria bacterium]